MVSILPYALSVAGSLCYGTATVLQQVGVKQSKKLKNINPLNLIALFNQSAYLSGIALDLLGWLLFLIAVRSLPLFLVQSFMALSIVVSALVDKYWLKHQIFKLEKLSIISVVVGVTLLSLVAKPSGAIGTSTFFKLILIFGPFLIAILSVILLKFKKSSLSTSLVAILVGISFGGTSIITRIIEFNKIDKQIIQLALGISLILYGLIAIILLAIALQRERINKVNSLVLASEVLVPSLIGLIFLGDTVKNDYWIVMIIGLILVSSGAVFTSLLANY